MNGKCMTRRSILGSLLPGLLAACSSSDPAPPFNSTEVSGIDYGRGLRIADTDGQPRQLEDFRGQVLVVVDTLPPDVRPAITKHTDPELASLAWRMRALDREEVVLMLQRAGAPVIPWVGPRSLDQVLRRLTRVDRRPA